LRKRYKKIFTGGEKDGPEVCRAVSPIPGAGTGRLSLLRFVNRNLRSPQEAGMKNRLLLLICCGALLLGPAAGAASAQESSPLPDAPMRITERHTPVAVEHEGGDSIGSRLSTRVKELLNGSNLFMLQETDKPKFRILLSTVPEFDSRPGVGSAYSVVWVFSLSEATLRHYLAREVGVLTAEEVNDTAARIVERTDSLAIRYGYLFPESPGQE
jgi:hypothetical protein